MGTGVSNVAQAAMYFQYNAQAPLHLTPDDNAAICEIYPPDGRVGRGCHVAPKLGATDEEQASLVPPFALGAFALFTLVGRTRNRRFLRPLPKHP